VAITDGTSGIVTLKNDNQLKSGQPFFDMQGRCVGQQPTQKGVYIQNGKKMVIR